MTREEIFRQKQSVVLYFLCFLDLVGTRNGHSLTKGDGLVGFEMGTHERAQVVTHAGTRMCAHNVDTREGGQQRRISASRLLLSGQDGPL